jgi:spore germination protein KA
VPGVSPAREALDDLKRMLARLDGRLHALLSALSRPEPDVAAYDGDVESAFAQIRAGMGQSSDIQLRRLSVPGCPDGPVLVAAVDGLSDTQMVDQDIIAPLLTTAVPPARWDAEVLTPASVVAKRRWPDILQALAEGSTVVFAPGLPHAWIVDTVKYPQRAIGRAETEMAVRGPQEGFTEILLTQKTQIRRRFRTPALRFWDVPVGRLQHVTTSVVYLEGLTNPALVEAAVQRLKALTIDGIATATTIAGLIRDHPRSIFPTIRNTERVDVVVWRLLQGGVAILVDGDPFALLAPAPLMEFYATAMDYTSSWVDATFVRLIRFAGWIIGMYLPAFYIAMTEINPNVLPASLFVIMQGSHAGLPFSPVAEILLMILVIEILRESALRLPKVLSTTIGTVGAIVVGTAVVRAGLVDPQIIVLMTLTALALFSTPVYELTGTWRVVGFVLLTASAILGLLGLVLVTMVFLAVVMDMQSFGVPYFAPWEPFQPASWGDAIFRLPWTVFRSRWTFTRSQVPHWREPERPAPRPHLHKRRHEA